jgi:hypothetical protein
VIKSRRIRWVRHVACVGEMRHIYSILFKKRKGKVYLGDLDVDWRIILK